MAYGFRVLEYNGILDRVLCLLPDGRRRIRLEPGSAKAVPKPLVAKARGCRLDLQKRDAKEVFEALTERRKKEVYGLGLG